MAWLRWRQWYLKHWSMQIVVRIYRREIERSIWAILRWLKCRPRIFTVLVHCQSLHIRCSQSFRLINHFKSLVIKCSQTFWLLIHFKNLCARCSWEIKTSTQLFLSYTFSDSDLAVCFSIILPILHQNNQLRIHIFFNLINVWWLEYIRDYICTFCQSCIRISSTTDVSFLIFDWFFKLEYMIMNVSNPKYYKIFLLDVIKLDTSVIKHRSSRLVVYNFLSKIIVFSNQIIQLLQAGGGKGGERSRNRLRGMGGG